MRYSQIPRKHRLRISLSIFGVAFLLAIVVPTLASQLGKENNVANSEIASPSSSPSSLSESPESSKSSTPLQGEENQLAISEPTTSATPNSSSVSSSPTPSPSPTVLPPNLQKYSLGIPSSVLVDPRAQTVYFPEIELQGTTSTLVCISSDYGQIDINQRNVIDNSAIGTLKISGDASNDVMISGPASIIASAINGNGGLALYSYSRPISKIVITFQVVAVSEPVLNSSFCGTATSENTKRTQIKALGINLDTKKGSIPLRSPTPRD